MGLGNGNGGVGSQTGITNLFGGLHGITSYYVCPVCKQNLPTQDKVIQQHNKYWCGRVHNTHRIKCSRRVKAIKYIFYHDGAIHAFSTPDMAEYIGASPSTVYNKHRDGWTARELLGLDEHEVKKGGNPTGKNKSEEVDVVKNTGVLGRRLVCRT